MRLITDVTLRNQEPTFMESYSESTVDKIVGVLIAAALSFKWKHVYLWSDKQLAISVFHIVTSL